MTRNENDNKQAGARPLMQRVVSTYHRSGLEAFISEVHETVLKRKVKYPILEYIATEFYKNIPDHVQTDITDRVIGLKENGSDVIAGKILQLRLPDHYDDCIARAAEYISREALAAVRHYWRACNGGMHCLPCRKKHCPY